MLLPLSNSLLVPASEPQFFAYANRDWTLSLVLPSRGNNFRQTDFSKPDQPQTKSAVAFL
jgi:hypothetical protein